MKNQLAENYILIEEHSLYSFLLEVQDAVAEGYRFSDANADMPQGYVGFYSCRMLRDPSFQQQNTVDAVFVEEVVEAEEVVLQEAEADVNVAVATEVQKAKPGRKAKTEV